MSSLRLVFFVFSKKDSSPGFPVKVFYLLDNLSYREPLSDFKEFLTFFNFGASSTF